MLSGIRTLVSNINEKGNSTSHSQFVRRWMVIMIKVITVSMTRWRTLSILDKFLELNNIFWTPNVYKLNTLQIEKKQKRQSQREEAYKISHFCGNVTTTPSPHSTLTSPPQFLAFNATVSINEWKIKATLDILIE